MKNKILKCVVCFALASITALSVSCAKPKNYEKSRIAPVVAYAEVDETLAKNGEGEYFSFTANLLKSAYSGNTIVAPLSTYSAIGMIANGASGDTLSQIENALGSTEKINQFSLYAKQAINKASDKTKANVANSIWIEETYKQAVKEDYLNDVSKYYGPEVFSLPFDKSALKRVNNWAYNNTDGMIDRAIEKFYENSKMVLVSASSVKGKWASEAKRTNSGTFTTATGKQVNADYFSGSSSLYQSKNAYAIRRYMENGFYFMAVMPNVEIGEYLENLNGEELVELFNKTNPRGANYKMPEFETQTEKSLVEPLKKMDITDAFNRPLADFTLMTDATDGLYVNDIVQNAKIEVNKNGLEASATIKIDMGAKGAAAPELEPLYISFDKPFVYFVCIENVPIFAGVLNEV